MKVSRNTKYFICGGLVELCFMVGFVISALVYNNDYWAMIFALAMYLWLLPWGLMTVLTQQSKNKDENLG